jgi:hypothetical protein
MILSEEISDSEVNVRVDKDFNIKIIRQIPKSRIIIYFNLTGVFSRFRTMKNMMQSPVKIRIKAGYSKSNRLDILFFIY